MNADHVAVAAAGLFLLAGLAWLLPRLRARFEEPADDERAVFRDRHPDAMGLVEAGAGREEGDGGDLAPGECPGCGTLNASEFTFCRDCGRRLPETARRRDEHGE